MFNAETPYYDFDKYGFTYIGELDLSEPDYSFDILGVWKSENGMYWISEDSGCSCVSPWENLVVAELEGPYTADEACKSIEASWRRGESEDGYDLESYNSFISTIV